MRTASDYPCSPSGPFAWRRKILALGFASIKDKVSTYCIWRYALYQSPEHSVAIDLKHDQGKILAILLTTGTLRALVYGDFLYPPTPHLIHFFLPFVTASNKLSDCFLGDSESSWSFNTMTNTCVRAFGDVIETPYNHIWHYEACTTLYRHLRYVSLTFSSDCEPEDDVKAHGPSGFGLHHAC